MLSGGNRFVGCVSFIIIYIFIMFQFEFIYLYEYSLNHFYFFDCIVGFWFIVVLNWRTEQVACGDIYQKCLTSVR